MFDNVRIYDMPLLSKKKSFLPAERPFDKKFGTLLPRRLSSASSSWVHVCAWAAVWLHWRRCSKACVQDMSCSIATPGFLHITSTQLWKAASNLDRGLGLRHPIQVVNEHHRGQGFLCLLEDPPDADGGCRQRQCTGRSLALQNCMTHEIGTVGRYRV